ncbi:threonine dehydratase [Arboricoccus pini]|uniref:Threonine dehydratase n=1 Tax=Arboricoccus pini TaxID=1963835 RepID=A0A212RYP6_9PROT|nr:pyridoxal-phosphate dependent enzyme [Arboricoccus pini]SNB77960.1 threonine dehydratase [Arboricoccus pini]
MIELADIEAAALRLKGKVRRTPMMRADQLLEVPSDAELWLKLENLQVTGSFKARGATNRLLTTPAESLNRGIVTASGGNHGVAVARAAHLAKVPATIFLPEGVSPLKRAKLEAWGAQVQTVGMVWDEANEASLRFAAEKGAMHFHPFAEPAIVAGQGTVALEVLSEKSDIDTFLIAIGGGGLIAGMATAIKAIRPNARIIGIEPVGSPTLEASRRAGEVVRLPAITTRVPTMACGRTDPRIFEIVQRHVDEIVLLEDEEMAAAANWLWLELGIAADLSGAAAAAALRTGKVKLRASERVCVLICGAGNDAVT